MSETFRKYADWNHRDGAELFVDQTRKLATELYTQTAAIAPSEAEIAADVRAQGWKIPKRFADGREGRGSNRAWAGWSYWQAIKNKTIKRFRGRGARQKNWEQESAMRDQKPTLAMMQAYVIALRKNARLFLASGWLGAIFDLGGSLKKSSGKVDHERGGAEIHHNPHGVEVVLWNRTPGIETMDQKTHFVAKAVAVRTADMWVYIRRKMDEAAKQIFRAAA